MRTHYKNGDAVGLVHTGCDGCNPSIIGGILAHELGCSESWRDYLRSCRWCGHIFYPTEREQFFCDEECAKAFWG